MYWCNDYYAESEYLNVLEGRTWDKTAKDFAKNEKKQIHGK